MVNKQIPAEFLPRDDSVEVLFPPETEAQQTAADKAAEAMVEELSSNDEKGKTVNIYKQTGNGQESMAHVMSHPADKYTIQELVEILKVEYGGGDYRFHLRSEKGRLIANKLIVIAKKLSPDAGTQETGMLAILGRMMDKQDEFMRRILPTQETGGSRIEFMKEMSMMKDLFSGGQQANPLGQAKEMLELIDLLKKQANPEADEGGGFTKIISDSLPLLDKMADVARENNRAVTRNRPRQGQQPEQNPMKKTIVKKLLSMRANKEHPADVAEKLNGQIPPYLIPQIEKMILGDNAVEELININPNVEPHKEWFKDVIEWLKGYMGHPCKYDDQFETGDTNKTGGPDDGGQIDNAGEFDHNSVNHTNTAAAGAQNDKPDDGNTGGGGGNQSDA